MKDIGKMVRNMEKERLNIKMMMFMMAIGNMVRKMVTVKV